jgi:hypothetical protein
MSSHREAPQMSKDPTADSTDLYAFVSPDKPSTVTLIANYIPLQAPDGGPNFYEFADDVRYAIHVDNDGDGKADVSFHFRFKTVNNIPESFLYNDGPITPFTPPGTKGTNWNRQQTYTLTRVDHPNHGKDKSTVLGRNLLVPPCNIGPLSTPRYAATYLASHGHSAIHHFRTGRHHGTVFAGQRAEGFYVDLGAVFDLGGLRGFENFHVGGPGAGLMAGMPGVNSSAAVNVHSLALQIPIVDLVAGGHAPSSTTSSNAVIGVWTTASRQKVQVNDGNRATGENTASGPFVQVSRLGNPLVNELLIGLGDKDRWNVKPPPSDGSTFFEYFANPLLGQLIPALYTANGKANGSTIFPNLKAYNASHTGTTKAHAARPDLVAILLSGIPNSDDRVARRCRRDDPVGGSELHSGRPGRLGRLQPDPQRPRHHSQGHREVPVLIPVPRYAVQRLLDTGEDAGSQHALNRMTTMETLPEPSGPGSVVLDIGGEVGAAAVYVPASLAGFEIEIRRDDEEWAGRHVAVRERVLPAGSVWAALFPSLVEGIYQIRVRGGDPAGPTATLAVTGGRVTTRHWLDD